MDVAVSPSRRRQTRSGGRAAADDSASGAVGITSLPLHLFLHCLLKLPLLERVRAELVCRTWRNALRTPELWTNLSLHNEATDTVLEHLSPRCIAAGWRSLDVTGCTRITAAAVLAAVRASRDAAPAGLEPPLLAVRAPSLWWSADQVRAAYSLASCSARQHAAPACVCVRRRLC